MLQSVRSFGNSVNILMTEKNNLGIHYSLRKLIELKSLRDGCDFTAYKLAQETNIPHSILTKLIHLDESKRVINPRVDTLRKIIRFFQNDGFNVTIDSLISGFLPTFVGIATQTGEGKNTEPNTNIHIPLYTENIGISRKLSDYEVDSNESNASFAIRLDHNHHKLFKKNYILIVSQSEEVEHKNIVLYYTKSEPLKFQLGKVFISNEGVFIGEIDDARMTKRATSINALFLIGVVIEVIATT